MRTHLGRHQNWMVTREAAESHQTQSARLEQMQQKTTYSTVMLRMQSCWNMSSYQELSLALQIDN